MLSASTSTGSGVQLFEDTAVDGGQLNRHTAIFKEHLRFGTDAPAGGIYLLLCVDSSTGFVAEIDVNRPHLRRW